MKMEISDHAGEISKHNSFDWMARCLRDSADAVVRGNQTYVPENAIHRLKHVVLIMLDRLALIEGTNGAQWDDFLPRANPTFRPHADPSTVQPAPNDRGHGFLRWNVKVEVAANEAARLFKTSAIIESAVCTAGLGHDAQLVDSDFDVTRGVVVLHFYDPDRSGRVAGTDLRADRTDEVRVVAPIFQRRDPPLESHVGAALDWLKEDCRRTHFIKGHEAEAMERIDTLTRYFGLVRR